MDLLLSGKTQLIKWFDKPNATVQYCRCLDGTLT